MFRRMDKDRNGSLSREEFALGLKETQLTVEHHDVEELFKQFDTDNNGRINYDEFLTAIRVGAASLISLMALSSKKQLINSNLNY